jgi:hypothetical protein
MVVRRRKNRVAKVSVERQERFDHLLQTCVTRDDYLAVKRAAHDEGLTMASWLRSVVHGQFRKGDPQ